MNVGITGTKGKTTIAHIVHHCLSCLDAEVETLSTLGLFKGAKRLTGRASFSTAELLLASKSETKCVEMTSFMLSNDVFPDDFLDVAIVTGIERGEHTEIHESFIDYVSAKKVIFEKRKSGRKAFVCIDNENCHLLLDSVENVETYGFCSESDVTVSVDECTDKGMEISIVRNGISTRLFTRLLGRHNALNVTAAYLSLLEVGMSEADIIKSIAGCSSARGRFERFFVNRPGRGEKLVIIDYAHTTQSLEANLELIKEIYPSKKLCTVFGCGGNKTKIKRPLMGRVASLLSDEVILTNDNPRDESPERIIDDIILGVVGPYSVEMDREKAIELSLESECDIVLLAGKGAEELYIDAKGAHVNRSDERLLTRCCGEKNYELISYHKHT